MILRKRNCQLPHTKRLGRPHRRARTLSHLIDREPLRLAQPHNQQPLRLQSTWSMQQQRLAKRRLELPRRQHLRRRIRHRIRSRKQRHQRISVLAYRNINGKNRKRRRLKTGRVLKKKLRVHSSIVARLSSNSAAEKTTKAELLPLTPRNRSLGLVIVLPLALGGALIPLL